MTFAAILICDVLFWALLLGGLLVRYALSWTRVATVMLWMTPIVDIGLLVFTLLELQSGQISTIFHGSAALYISFSTIFGPTTARVLDATFARRFGREKGTVTASPERRSAATWWWRVVFASLITLGLLIVLIVAAGMENSFWLTYWGIVAITLPVTAPIGSWIVQLLRRKRVRSPNG